MNCLKIIIQKINLFSETSHVPHVAIRWLIYRPLVCYQIVFHFSLFPWLIVWLNIEIFLTPFIMQSKRICKIWVRFQQGKQRWMFCRQCFAPKHRVIMEECDMTHRGRYDFFLNCQIIDDIGNKKKESVIILSWELGCYTAWAIKFTDTHDELERLTRISIARRNLKMQGAKCQGPGQRYSI